MALEMKLKYQDEISKKAEIWRKHHENSKYVWLKLWLMKSAENMKKAKCRRIGKISAGYRKLWRLWRQ
jgi:hypothetical protein